MNYTCFRDDRGWSVVSPSRLLPARGFLPFLLTSSLLGRSFFISRAFLIPMFCHSVAPSVFRCSFPSRPRSSLLPMSSVIALFFFECHSLLNRSFLFLLEVSVDPRFLGVSLISCFDCYASYLTAPSAEKISYK